MTKAITAATNATDQKNLVTNDVALDKFCKPWIVVLFENSFTTVRTS